MSLICADARSIPLRDRSVQCVVTSPPYFGLRDYGIPQQIGLETTPGAYVSALVAVFQEVRRVLRDDGVVWLNLGDSYAGNANSGGANRNDGGPAVRVVGLSAKPGKAKDLLGIPWRVAFALQADGWYLRSDVIWAKPNPMPESVRDRPTRSHEYLFLLAKAERYFYDADAIAEVAVHGGEQLGIVRGTKRRADAMGVARSGNEKIGADATVRATRNRRTVWTITPQPYSGAHFATMPEKLVRPCILAGSRPGDRVLDPFVGSGTVGAVAQRLERRWVGIDLNPAYHALAKRRTAQQGFQWVDARP